MLPAVRAGGQAGQHLALEDEESLSVLSEEPSDAVDDISNAADDEDSADDDGNEGGIDEGDDAATVERLVVPRHAPASGVRATLAGGAARPGASARSALAMNAGANPLSASQPYGAAPNTASSGADTVGGGEPAAPAVSGPVVSSSDASSHAASASMVHSASSPAAALAGQQALPQAKPASRVSFVDPPVTPHPSQAAMTSVVPDAIGDQQHVEPRLSADRERSGAEPASSRDGGGDGWLKAVPQAQLSPSGTAAGRVDPHMVEDVEDLLETYMIQVRGMTRDDADMR